MRIAIALLVGIVGCAPPDVAVTDTLDGPDAPRVGEFVTVQVRRDHLGASSDLPIPPTTHSYNGAATCVRGKLQVLTDRWVVVDSGSERHWVARSSVLLVTTAAD